MLVWRVMGRIFNLASEREARRTSEDFAEIASLAHGGVTVTAQLDHEAGIVWEFDREQALVFIQAMTMAVVNHESVKIVQPALRRVS